MSDNEQETARIIDEYLVRLEKSLEDMYIPKSESQDIISEIRTHIEDSIESSKDKVKAVHAVIKDLGDPENYAQNLKEDGYFTTKSNREFKLKSSGRVLGMPYDFEKPSLNKIAERMWNPSDPRILRPKVFGVGWAINFGALAVKLGLLRPDDEEDVPFSNVPDRVLSIGMLLSIAINLVSVIIAAVYLSKLPAKVPAHFGLHGPDLFLSPIGATIWWLGLPVLSTFIILYFVFIKQKSRLARAIFVAILSSFSLLSCGAYIDSVYYAFNNRLIIHPSIIVAAMIAIWFLMLVVFSKTGLREEWRKNKVIGVRKPNA